MSVEPVARHPDFEKIHSAFLDRYGKLEGEKEYNSWLQKLDLDESKAYGDSQRSEKIAESLESKQSIALVTESLVDLHTWIKPHLDEIRKDKAEKTANWYLVNALFPWTSMNANTYTDEELADASRSIIDKPNDLNHTDEKLDIETRDAQYFKKSTETLERVPTGASCSAGNLCQLIDNAEAEENGIVHVSVEAKCLRGTKPGPEGEICNGLCFTGKGWLTKKVLPGVPLTRIQPLEKLLECLACKNGACSFHGQKINKEVKNITNEKEAKFCPSCGKPLEDGECKNKECELVGKKIGLADGDEKKTEATVKTPCEQARESLLQKVKEMEIELGKKVEMTQGELDFVKGFANVDSSLAGLGAKFDQVLKMFQDHIAASQPGSQKPEETGTANLLPAQSAAIPTQSPIEKKVIALRTQELLTEAGMKKRFLEYKEKGFSRQDAWRCVAMDVLEAAQQMLHPVAPKNAID